MLLKSTFSVLWTINLLSICVGTVDVPFFDDSPKCSQPGDDVPSHDFEEPTLPFEKRFDTIFYPDMSIPLTNLSPFYSDQEIQYIGSTELNSNAQNHLKKRSIFDSDENSASGDDELQPSLSREARNKDNIKTIHLSSSFTPRLGRKRSGEDANADLQDTYKKYGIASKARVIDLKAGNAFTPRLGRSEEKNKIHLFAGSAFTPRLGRSEEPHKIRFNAGNAFTPRLGRSEGSQKIHINAGRAYTPRLGRSGMPNRVIFNAGSAFTPRLGRSDNPNRVFFNAGSAFTPRLGRSDNSNRVFFNAGSAFTPRLGRSKKNNRIHLNAGGAFTPRLGRAQQDIITDFADRSMLSSEKFPKQNRLQLNAGRAFTPRLG